MNDVNHNAYIIYIAVSETHIQLKVCPIKLIIKHLHYRIELYDKLWY